MAVFTRADKMGMPIDDTIAKGLYELGEYCKTRKSCNVCAFEYTEEMCICDISPRYWDKYIKGGAFTDKKEGEE